MKVLHVVHGYFPAIGGSEFLFQRISEQLVAAYQDQVRVFTTYGYHTGFFVDPSQPAIPHRDNEVLNGVQIQRFPVNNQIAPRIEDLQRRAYLNNWPLNDILRTLYHGPISWPMFKAIWRARADVMVVSSFPYLHMYYPAISRRFNHVPVVLCGALHPGDRWCFDRPIIYKAIAACDMYLAYTPFERDFVIARGAAPGKVGIASPGVDVAPFLAADGSALRRALGWEDKLVVGYIGQQAAHKGIDTLYQAMRLVWRQLPQARLLVAGGRTLYSPHLDRMLAAFAPQERDRIHVVTNFTEDEKPNLFAACDVFASPSGFESFGITFLEAWAAGKPVVSCRSGAIPTVVADGQDGLLVPYQDAAQLASVILELLTDEALRWRMGQRGKERVLTQHTWEIAIARFRQAYQRATERRIAS